MKDNADQNGPEIKLALPAAEKKNARQKRTGSRNRKNPRQTAATAQKQAAENKTGADTGDGQADSPAADAQPAAGAENRAQARTGSRNRKNPRKRNQVQAAASGVAADAAPVPNAALPVPVSDNPAREDSANQKKVKGKRPSRSSRKSASPIPPAQGFPVPDFASTLFTLLALPPGRPEKTRKKKKPVEMAAPAAQKKTIRRMFISILPGEQVEVALAEDNQLLEYYLDMLHQSKLKGNIYKGIIQNIDVNLQAAFVDFGIGKNGFLQIAEVHPEYWGVSSESGEAKKYPPIQKILKVGQELLVQVVKEPSGNKGAFLTTWLSLAGRFLVLTPGQEQIGVSRKVSDPQERNRLRELMTGLDPGKGFGVIVRTVGEGATKTTLRNDLQYLKRLWREIRKKGTELKAPALLYQEPALSERSIRDYLTDDVAEVWIDNEAEAASVRTMVNLLFPRKRNLVHVHEDTEQSLWERFRLASQLEQIYNREVILPSGGRLVFDQTEALMAIDINSGKISGKTNFESMAFKTNMEASEVIAKQLRLRDIGGQVVIDFIEMRDKKHILAVEKNLRLAMKNDRARHDIAKMSSFGLLELVRQRMGSSAISISMETCSACGGTGLRRNLEWQAMQTLRDFRHRLKNAHGNKLLVELSRELGLYILNHKRDTLQMLEEDFDKKLVITLTSD